MVQSDNRFAMRRSVDDNLRVSSACDANRDIFVDGSADNGTPMLPIKVGDVGSAPNKTDSYRCLRNNHGFSLTDLEQVAINERQYGTVCPKPSWKEI